MFSKKRAARVVPFVVLFGALGVGALALPWTGALPAEAFNYAVAGVCLFFLARWFSRKVRKHQKHLKKESAAQRRDRRRAIRKASLPVGR